MSDKIKIWVCSLQYSPIYKSHCCALGRQAEQRGYEVKYLFSLAYSWMLSQEIIDKTFFIGNSTGIATALLDGFNPIIRKTLVQLFNRENPEYIYFYNFHPILNELIASCAKKNGCKFIQHVQEPYVENKRVYKGMQQYWLEGFEYLQERVINRSDTVIVSSQRSLLLFKKRYKKFYGNLMIIPLIYEDFGEQTTLNPNRQFITFIGPPVPAKGSEIFLKIVQYCQEKNMEYQFLLVTREKINDPRYHQYENLKIIYYDKISDEMMVGYQMASKMVLTPYTIATQSSVVLTSYRYGTPALSSNIGGLPEFIEHKKTGYLVDVNAPVTEWVNGINFIGKNLDEMSVHCRNYYQNNFSESNWPRYFRILFNE